MNRVSNGKLSGKVGFVLLAIILALGGVLMSCGTAKPAKQFTIGVTVPTAQNLALSNWLDGIKATAEARGMKVIDVDDQLKVEKQVANLDQLIAQKVDAIIVWPMDPKALGPVLDRAQKAGIKLFGVDYNVSTGGDQGPYVTQFVLGRKNGAEEAARLIAKAFGGKANVVGIGLGVPVPGNIYMMKAFKDESVKQGLNFLEQQDNPTDDAAGARPLMVNMLTKYPNIDGLFSYNDPSSVGAAAAIQAANRKLFDGKEGIMVLGFNASPDGIQAVKDGKLYATWDLRPWEAGMGLVEAANLLLTGKRTADKLPKEVEVKSVMVTKENMDKVFLPWDQAVKDIRNGKLDSMLPPSLK